MHFNGIFQNEMFISLKIDHRWVAADRTWREWPSSYSVAETLKNMKNYRIYEQ